MLRLFSGINDNLVADRVRPRRRRNGNVLDRSDDDEDDVVVELAFGLVVNGQKRFPKSHPRRVYGAAARFGPPPVDATGDGERESSELNLL